MLKIITLDPKKMQGKTNPKLECQKLIHLKMRAKEVKVHWRSDKLSFQLPDGNVFKSRTLG